MIQTRLNCHDLVQNSDTDYVESFGDTLDPNYSAVVPHRNCIAGSGTGETLAELLRCRMNTLLPYFSGQLIVISHEQRYPPYRLLGLTRWLNRLTRKNIVVFLLVLLMDQLLELTAQIFEVLQERHLGGCLPWRESEHPSPLIKHNRLYIIRQLLDDSDLLAQHLGSPDGSAASVSSEG